MCYSNAALFIGLSFIPWMGGAEWAATWIATTTINIEVTAEEQVEEAGRYCKFIKGMYSSHIGSGGITSLGCLS